MNNPHERQIIVYKLTKIKKSKEKSSRNTTTSNGGTPCASKNEYNDAKIKKLYHYNHNTVKYVAITQLNVWLSHN